jgi:hypothetical protein
VKLRNDFGWLVIGVPNARGLNISLLLLENREPRGSRALRRWTACRFGGTTLGVGGSDTG